MRMVLTALALVLMAMLGPDPAARAATVAPFDLVVEQKAGSNQVYRLGNGNYLGAWGFDTRDAKTSGGTVTAADIARYFTPNVVKGLYYGDAVKNAALNKGAREFTAIVAALTLVNGNRYSNSLWVEWTGGTLSFNSIGRTRSMNSGTVTLAGDPVAAAAVPLPAAGLLLLAGIGALAVMRRRKASAPA